MEGSSKENLINKNKKESPSFFYSITEKQEESNSSSSSSSCDSKLGKPIITDNSSNVHMVKFSELPKKETKEKSKNNDNNKPLNIYKCLKLKRLKTNNQATRDNKKSIKEEQLKKFLKLENIKTLKEFKSKRISAQQNINKNIFGQINNYFEPSLLRRNSSTKNASDFQLLNNSNNVKGKKNANFSTFNQLKVPIFNSPIPKQAMIKYKSIQNFHLSDKSGSIRKLYNNKRTFVKKKRVKINDNNDYNLQNNLFEKLKTSPMFEKTEKIISREKIIYGLMGFCTLMSIIFQIIDALLYNTKSLEYLEKINKKELLYIHNIENYKLMEKRKISKTENCMRVFNIIFSVLCIILTIEIYRVKNKFIKQTNKNTKNFYRYYLKHRKKKYNKNLNDEDYIKIIPSDYNLLPKKKLPKIEIVKGLINVIINLICYPPSINKVFISKNGQIITIYPLNSLLLILSFFKLLNLIRAVIHLIPLNNLLYKTICSSKMVKMDAYFMFKFLLQRHPKSFIFFYFVFNISIFCILILCLEYFSLNFKEGIWNNKGNDNLKNIYNAMYIYLFYIVKMGFGDIRPFTILGSLLMLIIGTSGFFIISYLIYYFNELIRFTPDEKKAYTKLKKILNPLNNEHKACNLIRFFLLMRKLTKEFETVENNYINKKKNRFKKFVKKFNKLDIFKYKDENEIYKNLTIVGENNLLYQEKTDYEIYLCRKFLLRVKVLSEYKIFKNELLIARNFSHFFTDLLRTLSYKMDQNLNLINNKLQLLADKEHKYYDYIKYQKKAMKTLKKVMDYQKKLIGYLVNNNNKNYESYLNKKRKIRKRGNFGSALYFNKYIIRKKIKNEIKKYEVFKCPKKVEINITKSSIVGNRKLESFENILQKTANDAKLGKANKRIKRRKRSKTIGLITLNNINIIRKTYMLGVVNLKKNNRKHSY